MSSHEYTIVDGPDSATLCDALKYAYGCLEATVKFIYLDLNRVDRLVAQMRITSLQHEDGSGCRFIFQGKMIVNSKEVNVNGYYNTKTKKGRYTF